MQILLVNSYTFQMYMNYKLFVSGTLNIGALAVPGTLPWSGQPKSTHRTPQLLQCDCLVAVTAHTLSLLLFNCCLATCQAFSEQVELHCLCVTQSKHLRVHGFRNIKVIHLRKGFKVAKLDAKDRFNLMSNCRVPPGRCPQSATRKVYTGCLRYPEWGSSAWH